jgi:hypothetical protein
MASLDLSPSHDTQPGNQCTWSPSGLSIDQQNISCMVSPVKNPHPPRHDGRCRMSQRLVLHSVQGHNLRTSEDLHHSTCVRPHTLYKWSLLQQTPCPMDKRCMQSLGCCRGHGCLRCTGHKMLTRCCCSDLWNSLCTWSVLCCLEKFLQDTPNNWMRLLQELPGQPSSCCMTFGPEKSGTGHCCTCYMRTELLMVEFDRWDR